jgi:hypothetical protein
MFHLDDCWFHCFSPQLVQCKVSAVGEQSLEVRVPSHKAALSIPHEHLTDHLGSWSQAILQTFKPGDQLKAIMWKDSQGIVVSL